MAWTVCPGSFLGQSPGGHTAQFVVNQGDQLFGRLPFPPLNRLQDDGDVSHGCACSSINAMAFGEDFAPGQMIDGLRAYYFSEAEASRVKGSGRQPPGRMGPRWLAAHGSRPEPFDAGGPTATMRRNGAAGLRHGVRCIPHKMPVRPFVTRNRQHRRAYPFALTQGISPRVRVAKPPQESPPRPCSPKPRSAFFLPKPAAKDHITAGYEHAGHPD